MPVSNQSTIVTYTANGSTTVFTFPFKVLKSSDLVVYKDGVVTTTGFTISGVGNPTGGSVTFSTAPTNGVLVRLQRIIVLDRSTDYVEGGQLAAEVLDADFDRIVMMTQDLDAVALQETGDGKFDGESKVIKNVANPVNAQDAVTKTWAETGMSSQLAQATTAATNAANSASSASTSATSANSAATSANSSATAASTSASNAATSATAASTSATSAATSATNAANSATSAATAATTASTNAASASSSATSVQSNYNLFRSQYYGSYSSAPSLDPLGAVPTTGDLYFNSTTAVMQAYNGSTWQAVAPLVSAFSVGTFAASGTTQATGTQLTTTFNLISSSNPGVSDGVVLPSAVPGGLTVLINTSGATVKVYPYAGQYIESAGANNPITIGSGTRLMFVSTTGTQWYAMTGVYA